MTMNRPRWILTWVLVLPLLTAGDLGNDFRSPRKNETTEEYSLVEGTTQMLEQSVSRVWRTVQSSPYTDEGNAKLKLVKKLLLSEAEDLTRPYISAAAGMDSSAETVPLDTVGRVWHLSTALSRLDLSFFNTNTSVEVVSTVEGIVSLGLHSAQRICMTQWRGRLILAVIEASGVSLHAVEPRTHRVHRTEGPPGRHSCDFGHVAGDHLVLVCITADKSKRKERLTMTKVKVYNIEENSMTPGRGALTYKFEHDIHVDSPRYVEIWSQKKETFCVIVSGGVMRQVGDQQVHFTRHTTSILYRWKGHHFDMWELLPGTNPVAAHHFMVNEFHYVAFANFQNNKGQHNCHSMIFRYSVHHGRYLPFQNVETRGATHLQSFTLDNKPFQHNFLAIANFCEDTNTGRCNHHTISAIYHYDEGKFKLFQEIETSYAVQWMAVQVNTTVLLALVSTMKGVTFYQHNGWKFIATPVQPSPTPFSVGVTSLASTFWDGRVVLGVTNNDTEKAAKHPSLYSISFATSNDLKEAYQDLKGLCGRLRRQVFGREVADLVRLAAISIRASEEHTFARHVTINGDLLVQASSHATEVFSQGRRVPGSIGQIKARMTDLERMLQHARRRLSIMLPVTQPVVWPARLHFANLMSADVRVSSADEVQALWVNGRDAPMLGNMVLLDGATHIKNLIFAHIELKAPSSVDHLQGQLLSAYVTLSGHHEIGGNLHFQRPLKARLLVVSNTLDGVQMSPHYLLLTTHAQKHAAALKCDSLHCNTLNIATVNDVVLDKLMPRLVTRSTNVTITGPLRVMEDLAHRGNLEVRNLLDLDLGDALLMKSLQEQVVFGSHQAGGLVSSSMATEESFNTVRIPADVFLSGSQHWYKVSSAVFSHMLATSVFIFHKLHNITVTENRLDLLLLSGKQVVTAPKTFTSLQLLEPKSPIYGSVGSRHRRWSNGICGSSKDRRPKSPDARREALLLGLRGMAAAQDLLTFLTEVQPGHFLVPLRTGLLFTLLKVDVNCAFIFLEDTERLMFFDIMTEDWRNEDNETVLVLDHKDLKRMVIEVENYKMEMTKLLHSIQLRWFDTWILVSKALQKVVDVHNSLNMVKLLIDLILSDENITPKTSHHCESVCGIHQDEDLLTLKCTRAALLTLRVVQRIAWYPILGSSMSQISDTQRMIFLRAAVHHDLGRLIEFLNTEDGLLPAVQAALPCRVVPLSRVLDNQSDLLKVLKQYKQELLVLSTYRDEVYDSPRGLEENRDNISPRDDSHEETSMKKTRTNMIAPVEESFTVIKDSLPYITKASFIGITKFTAIHPKEFLPTAHEESSTPTDESSSTPTDESSSTPTDESSSTPTDESSSTPTDESSSTPTDESSSTPTDESSSTPTDESSSTPTDESSSTPTDESSSTPTDESSSTPTDESSSTPTDESSSTPTDESSSTPTDESSSTPTAESSSIPTAESSSIPTAESSSIPTAESSSIPTAKSSSIPTAESSSIPTAESSSTPTAESSSTPTAESSSTPTAESSSTPTAESSSTPTAESSSTPTAESSSTPTAESSSAAATKGSPITAESPSTKQPLAFPKKVTISEETFNTGQFFTNSVESSLQSSFLTDNMWGAPSSHIATPALTQTQENPTFTVETERPNYPETIKDKSAHFQYPNLNDIPTSLRLMSESWQRFKRELPGNTGSSESSTNQTEYLKSLITKVFVIIETTDSVKTQAEPRDGENGKTSVHESYTQYPHFDDRSSAFKTKALTSLESVRNLSKREVEVKTFPSDFHHVGVAKGNFDIASHTTSVTFVQHLTTNIDCSNCMIQFLIIQTTTNCVSSVHVSPSMVTRKILTILMSPSSTTIDCTNCEFQIQDSVTVILPSSSLGDSYKTPHWTVSRINPTLYSARTFSTNVLMTDQTTLLMSSSSTPSHSSRISPKTTNTIPSTLEIPTAFITESSEKSWMVSSAVSKLEPPLINVDHSPELPSFTTYTRQSDPRCGEIPSHYYVESIQRDSFLAWLEAALLYFKEIQSINLTTLCEQLESYPGPSEKTSLKIIHDLMEDTTRIVKEILRNPFHRWQTSNLNLILEYEKFSTRMRTHLSFLKVLPDSSKRRLEEVRRLVVWGEQRIILVLYCLGRDDWNYETEKEETTVLWESAENNASKQSMDTPVSHRKATDDQSKIYADSRTTRFSHDNSPTIPGCLFTSLDLTSPSKINPSTHTITDHISNTWLMHYGTSTDSRTDTTDVRRTTSSESIAVITSSSSTITSSIRTTVYSLTDFHNGIDLPFRPRLQTDGSLISTQKNGTQDDNRNTLIPDVTPNRSEDAVTSPLSRSQPVPNQPHHREVGQGSWVIGRVAGHRLQDLVDRTFAHLPTRRGAAFFIVSNMARLNNITFKSGLRVQHVQGIDTRHLLQHGISIYGSTVHTSLIFTRPVQVSGPVSASTVNEALATSFVTLSGHHTLQHPFFFMGSVTAAVQIQVRNKINGLDLALFSKSVALTSSRTRQVLLQPITFKQVSAQRVIFGSGQVIDVSLEDLVPLGHPAVITGRKIFQDVMVQEGGTQATALTVHYINDVNITDLFSNSLIKNSGMNQLISGPVMFMNLVVLRKLNTLSGLEVPGRSGMQSFRINRIATRVLYRDQDVKMAGNLFLKDKTTIKDLTFRDRFDSVTVNLYEMGWLMNTSPQTISGSVVLASVRSRAVTVTTGAKVQGVDISRLLTKTVKVNEDVLVASRMKFSGNVLAAKIWVGGTVQGWNLSSEAVLQNDSDVVFISGKTFLVSFHVSGMLTAMDLGGTVASSGCRENNKKNVVIIAGTVRLTNAVLTSAVHIGQHVLKKDTMDGYWLLDRHAFLPQNMTFYKVTADHIETDSINGVDMAKLIPHLLRRTCQIGHRQVMSGHFFAPLLVVESLLTPGIATSRLNNRPLSDMEKLFTWDGHQTIKGHWTLQQMQSLVSLVTFGHINGIQMNDFCMVKKLCVITAKKTLAHDLIIQRDLNVKAGRTVQEVDVSEALRHAVNITTCGPVLGVTTFAGGFTVPRLVVEGLVDGIKVSTKDVLIGSGAQIMTGQMNISNKKGAGTVIGPSIRAVDGVFNGWNLSDHWHRGFRRDQDNIVHEMVTFSNLVIFRNVYDNHWNLRRLTAHANMARVNQNALNDLSQDVKHAISGMKRELWGWKSMQIFRGTAARLVPLWMSGTSGRVPSSCPHYMAVISLSGHTRLLVYSSDRRKYINTGVVLRGGCTRAVASYKSSEENYVVTAHTCTCNTSYSAISLISSNHQMAEVLEAMQVWRITARGPQFLKRIDTGALDVQVAEVGESVCLVVAPSTNNGTMVYCSSDSWRTFSGPRYLATGCSKKISVVQHRDSLGRLLTLLAVVGQDSNTLHDSILTLGIHDTELNDFILLKREALRGVQWVDMASHGTNLFLAVVSRGFTGDQAGKIIVYWVNVYGDDHPLLYMGTPRNAYPPIPIPEKLYSQRPMWFLHRLQTLTVDLPRETRIIVMPSGLIHLFVIGEHGNITRFTQRGIHRFAKEGMYHGHASGRQQVDVWMCVENDGEGSIKMAVSGSQCRKEKCRGPGHTDVELLEANFRPGSPAIH